MDAERIAAGAFLFACGMAILMLILGWGLMLRDKVQRLRRQAGVGVWPRKWMLRK